MLALPGPKTWPHFLLSPLRAAAVTAAVAASAAAAASSSAADSDNSPLLSAVTKNDLEREEVTVGELAAHAAAPAPPPPPQPAPSPSRALLPGLRFIGRTPWPRAALDYAVLALAVVCLCTWVVLWTGHLIAIIWG